MLSVTFHGTWERELTCGIASGSCTYTFLLETKQFSPASTIGKYQSQGLNLAQNMTYYLSVFTIKYFGGSRLDIKMGHVLKHPSLITSSSIYRNIKMILPHINYQNRWILTENIQECWVQRGGQSLSPSLGNQIYQEGGFSKQECKHELVCRPFHP